MDYISVKVLLILDIQILADMGILVQQQQVNRVEGEMKGQGSTCEQI